MHSVAGFASLYSQAWSRVLTHTWLANGGGSHKANERDIRGATGLQWDRVHPEVLQHVEDGLEPEVLHSTLTVLVQRQTEMLRARGQGQVRRWRRRS